MALQVIGGSFGRTGSHSLALALETIGLGPCYHTHAFQDHHEHQPLWQDALDGKPVDWEALFNGYRSTVEWPTVAFLPQILEAFPRACVVLTLRDPESWYESATATIFKSLRLAVHNPNPKKAVQALFYRRLILEHTFLDRYQEKTFAIRTYNQHVQMVRNLVPGKRLLAYDVRSGWEPLCAFLEAPIPDKPFPHHNERQAFLDQAPEWFKALERSAAKGEG
jgi:Sulfotransferase domain